MSIGFTFRRAVLFSAVLSVLLSSVGDRFASAARANELSTSSELASSELALLESWSLFTSEVGRFRVAMPSTPAAYTFSPELDATDSLMYMQMQLTDAAHLEIYAVAFVTVPEFDEGADIESILASCVTGLSNAALQSQTQAIELESYQGIEAEFQAENGLFQVSRCYLVGDRTYLLTASREPFETGLDLRSLSDADDASELSAGMEAFFRSFEILN